MENSIRTDGQSPTVIIGHDESSSVRFKDPHGNLRVVPLDASCEVVSGHATVLIKSPDRQKIFIPLVYIRQAEAVRDLIVDMLLDPRNAVQPDWTAALALTDDAKAA